MMLRVLGILAQILGCGFMIAMVTEVRVENVLTFVPSFPTRVAAGVTGMTLILLGGYLRKKATASDQLVTK